jgi:hypothetical protein
MLRNICILTTSGAFFLISAIHAQISITSADMQQWKADEYYDALPQSDSIPSFSLSVGPNVSNDFSMLSMPRCTTLDLNSTYKNAPDSTFRYGFKTVDNTEIPTGFGTFISKRREWSVNSFGEVVIPPGQRISYVGILYKNEMLIQSLQTRVFLYIYQMYAKQYGIVAEFTTMSDTTFELFISGNTYNKSEIFREFGKESQHISIMKGLSSGIFMQEKALFRKQSLFSILPLQKFDALGRIQRNELWARQNQIQSILFSNAFAKQ